MSPEIEAISHELTRLRNAKRETYPLYPPVPLHVVEAFEAEHGIRLPADYREFLMEMGNGGSGPHYDLFRLGEMDDGFDYAPYTADFIGDIAAPFPHTSAWNDLTGEPTEDMEEDEYDAAMEAFEARYYNPALTNGAIPICHIGCALRIWLVVTGPEAGHLWRDDRAEHGGLFPIAGPGHPRVTFATWYRAWIEDDLGERCHSWL